MKIMDEKGKLFGKINLIDFVVLVAIVAVVAGVAWKLVGGRVSNAVAESNAVTIRYEVMCSQVDKQIADYCVENYDGQLMSNGELLDGRITACTTAPQTETLVDADGNAVTVPVEGQQMLYFTIECKVAKEANTYTVGSQEVRVGKNHIVKTNLIELSGQVTAMEVVTEADNG